MQLNADFTAFGDLKNNHSEDHITKHGDLIKILKKSGDIKITYLFMSMRMCNVI